MVSQTVKSAVVFRPSDTADLIRSVFNQAKCDRGEGRVLYVRNIKTEETMMVKTKSSRYIILRFLREKVVRADGLLSSAFASVSSLRRRTTCCRRVPRSV